MMESIGFFARSRRCKIGPPFGPICASVVAILGVDFGPLVRIDGSRFLHPHDGDDDDDDDDDAGIRCTISWQGLYDKIKV